MAETLFGTGDPGGTEEGTLGLNHCIGQEVKTNATNKQINGGRIWIPSTGKPSGLRWLVYRVSDSAEMRNVLCDSLTGTADTWMAVPASVLAIGQDEQFIVAAWYPENAGAGNYPFASTGGPLAASGTLAISRCVYRDGTPAAFPSPLIPDQYGFTAGLFFVDANVEDAAVVETLEQITPTRTIFALGFQAAEPLVQIAPTRTVQPMSYQKVLVLNQIAPTTTVQTMTYQGGIPPIPPGNGWRPKVGRHAAYLQQKTVDGNTAYVKRRSGRITQVVGGDIVDLQVGHHGETYTNVDRRVDPNADVTGDYTSY